MQDIRSFFSPPGANKTKAVTDENKKKPLAEKSPKKAQKGKNKVKCILRLPFGYIVTLFKEEKFYLPVKKGGHTEYRYEKQVNEDCSIWLELQEQKLEFNCKYMYFYVKMKSQLKGKKVQGSLPRRKRPQPQRRERKSNLMKMR